MGLILLDHSHDGDKVFILLFFMFLFHILSYSAESVSMMSLKIKTVFFGQFYLDIVIVKGAFRHSNDVCRFFKRNFLIAFYL